MTTESFSPAAGSDAERALDTLVLAFAADPVERWLYPEARDYLRWFPAFLAAFGGRAFNEQTVWKLGEFSAVALWLPPGTEPDGDSIVAVLTESVAPEKHDDTFAVVGQTGRRASDVPALVPTLVRRRPGTPRQRPRQRTHGAMPADRRPGSPTRLPRNPEPAPIFQAAQKACQQNHGVGGG